MSTASPTAFLLWAILSVLFLSFMVYHLWCYDRFKCLYWSSGRQPGAFKRIMTYSYLGSVPLFTIFSVAITVLKFKEGYIVATGSSIIPKPLAQYSPDTRRWIIPLDFVFSFAWSFELITHLEELAFWLYLLHQNPQKEEWFSSWEYRFWYLGSMVAIIGMPLATLITRHNVDTCDAYIFLVGASGSSCTTLCFLYVLWNFPRFIKHVKVEGADPSVVVRLTTFYQLNLIRVVFRFLFTVPLLVLALDGIIVGPHVVNRSPFWVDFLLMIAGLGCFFSSAITLLIFFPRSIVNEAGYKPKPSTTLPNSPKSAPITPPFSSVVQSQPQLPLNQHPALTALKAPGTLSMIGSPSTSPLPRFEDDSADEWEDESDYHGGEVLYHQDVDHVPPHPLRARTFPGSSDQPQSEEHMQLQAQLHSHILAQRPSQLHIQTLAQLDPQTPEIQMTSPQVSMQPHITEHSTYQRHTFSHSPSSPYIPQLPRSPPSPKSSHTRIHPYRRRSSRRHQNRRVSVVEVASRPNTTRVGLGIETSQNESLQGSLPLTVTTPSSRTVLRPQSHSTLHPYVMTFTSPIDLVDIPPQTSLNIRSAP